MKRKYYLFVVTIMLIIPLLVAQVVITREEDGVKEVKVTVREPVLNPHIEKVIGEYEAQLDLLNLLSKTPGAAIAIVKDSVIVYMKGFGVREVGTRDSVDVHTVFRLASVSKCFASFLTGILVQEGQIGWDDPVQRYVPDFQLHSEEETRKLRIRHVLSHTTGLPFHAYTNLVEEGLPLPEMLSQLRDVPLSSKVGQLYSYQNVAYSLVGEAIHKATGKTYEAAMIERVFGPLNMTDASLDYFSMMTNANIAKPHMPKKDGWRKVSINNTYYNVSPAGGVNASISDMAQWMIALLGNRPSVIQPQTLSECFTPAVKAPSKNRNYSRGSRLQESHYGLGWRILHYPNDTLMYHGGFVNGYRSEVAISPKDNLAICILANAPGEFPDNGIPVFFNVLREHREKIREWDQQHSLAPDSLKVF
jgi:beta-lactamase class C